MSQPILPPNDELLRRIRDLERRIAELERAPQVVNPPVGG